MKPNLLLPPVFRVIGFIILLPGLVIGYLFIFNHYLLPFFNYGPGRLGSIDSISWFAMGNLTDELATSLVITGLLFIGFSRLKNETAITTKLRTDSLYWAVIVDQIGIAVMMIILSMGDLLKVYIQHDLIVNYNVFIMPAIFLGRFYYLLSREKNGKSNATNYLLPNQRFNIAGKILTVLFVLLVFIVAEFNIKTFDTLLFLILPCLLLWIGSKEKNENDQVNEIRLKAMQLSVYISYSLYFIATWLTYGWDYLMAQIVSLVAVQVIFLVIFYYLRYRASKEKLQTT